MRNGVTIWHLQDLIKFANSCAVQIDGKYLPARPYGWTDILTRLKAAWMVLTEKADVVVWPGNQ